MGSKAPSLRDGNSSPVLTAASSLLALLHIPCFSEAGLSRELAESDGPEGTQGDALGTEGTLGCPAPPSCFSETWGPVVGPAGGQRERALALHGGVAEGLCVTVPTWSQTHCSEVFLSPRDCA